MRKNSLQLKNTDWFNVQNIRGRRVKKKRGGRGGDI